MKIIYIYPEDVENGDDLVVDDILISPSQVEIQLRKHRVKYDPHLDRMGESLRIADRLVTELRKGSNSYDPGVINLLVQSYSATRPTGIFS